MRLSSVMLVVMLGVAACVAACTTIPAVPIKPLAAQNPQQENRDARECAEAAKPEGAPSYEACMIARRYQVAHHVVGDIGQTGRQFGFMTYKNFGTPEIDLTMNIETTQARTPEQVAADIDACRSELRARGTKSYGPFGASFAEPDRVLKLAKYYTDCMEPRGYKTTLWEDRT